MASSSSGAAWFGDSGVEWDLDWDSEEWDRKWDQQWDPTVEELMAVAAEWDPESWGETWELEEWDPETWGETWELEEWDPSWDFQEDPVDPRQLHFDNVGVETGEVTEKKTVPEKVDGEVENYPVVNGFVWDPINLNEIELGNMTSHSVGQHGGWTALFQGLDGNEYTVSRLPCRQPDQPAPEVVVNKQPRDEKIQYTPVSKNAFTNFAEKAWPKSAEPGPGASGLNQSSRESVPTTSEVEMERMKYQDQPCGLLWEGASMTKMFGNKPDANADPLGLETIQGMTLKEHIIHVQWYACTADFKEKVPPGISQQLWEELVEIFKIVHVYGITDPEIVYKFLRHIWANAYYGLNYCLGHCFISFCVQHIVTQPLISSQCTAEAWCQSSHFY